MRSTTRRAAVLIATGALGIGGLAVAAPAIADANSAAHPATTAAGPGPGWHASGGMGGGMGDRTRLAPRGGGCGNLAVTAAGGTLTAAQKSTLTAMAEEEKLAHDLYTAFAVRYPAAVFDRIAAAETQHLAAVRTLLARYGLTDPTAGRAVGEFGDPATRATYQRLLARGSAGRSAALGVGRTVEQTDIADLRAALKDLTAPDARQVYTNLLSASQHHLIAFEHWSGR